MKWIKRIMIFTIVGMLNIGTLSAQTTEDPETPPAPLEAETPTDNDSTGESVDTNSDIETVPGESLVSEIGVNLFEEEMDYVIFKTNEFITNKTFTGTSGPFWWILEICFALSAMFCLIMAAQMAFKMMVKHEPIEVLKLLRPLAISIVLSWWYPTQVGHAGFFQEKADYCFLDLLAVIPNAIGSYTAALYGQEALQVKNSYESLQRKMMLREQKYNEWEATVKTTADGAKSYSKSDSGTEGHDPSALLKFLTDTNKTALESGIAGVIIFIDKILMFAALLLFRIGWWGTIYSQQILLAVLTIFGPIHWAMSLLPKWESSWSKWIARYMSVHFYGAMLYFVGFYVLLLFDIVISIEIADIDAVIASNTDFVTYLKNCVFTSGYLMVAAAVSLKCLGMVPDLAAWIFPEGDVAFSARNFGAGLADAAHSKIGTLGGKTVGGII